MILDNIRLHELLIVVRRSQSKNLQGNKRKQVISNKDDVEDTLASKLVQDIILTSHMALRSLLYLDR